MKKYSIKAAERLSGVKAHTLRVWEQRYGLLQPTRSQDGNHRMYSNDELKALLKIVYLYHRGYKISQIARLQNHEIEQIIEDFKDEKGTMALLLIELKESIIDLDEVRFTSIMQSLILQYGVKSAMIRIIFPLLNQVGLLWMTDKVIPGQEHFASNIVMRKLVKAINDLQINRVQRSGQVMLLTPTGEHHEIALLFFRYLLLANGYNTLYIGASVSNEVVESYYQKFLPSHVLINFTSNLQELEISDYLQELIKLCPESQIVVAGAAIRMKPPVLGGIRVLLTDKEMIGFCENIFDGAMGD
jgi:MerR family transcriptional regulator, light-induced transcriptional regulator